MTSDIESARAVMAERAEPFADLEGLARLADRYAGARVVCLGESTHGTSEFYRARAAITLRLVARHGFRIVAVEADWPDAAAWNADLQGAPRPPYPSEPFARFPRWMWRNAETRELLDRLGVLNRARDAGERAGFYGLDMYSLCTSADAVLDHIARTAPGDEAEARALYGCLKPYCGEPGRVPRVRSAGAASSCEAAVGEVVRLLARQVGDAEAAFGAAQNARLVASAEAYYRAMSSASERSWNLRDRHMAATLDRIMSHLGPGAKAVVWAHNTHVGDARATEMGWRRGELSIGQLLRERWGAEAALIGFATDTGTVAAASDWGGPMEIRTMRPALPSSWEDCARRTGLDAFLLDLRGGTSGVLDHPRIQRAIGVIYRPESERLSHYIEARLAGQFDGWVWLRTTRAVAREERAPVASDGPDLYPSGV